MVWKVPGRFRRHETGASSDVILSRVEPRPRDAERLPQTGRAPLLDDNPCRSYVHEFSLRHSRHLLGI